MVDDGGVDVDGCLFCLFGSSESEVKSPKERERESLCVYV